jgi:hypothetical protein
MGKKMIVITGASVALIDRPQAEIYTNPGTGETVARYYADVGAFEQAMGH